MTDYEGMVREFHEKFGHHRQAIDTIYPADIVKLREKLIKEEAEEFSEACHSGPNLRSKDWIAVDTVEVADALADLLYVVFGAAITFGIPIGKVFAEVHRSNMTKSLDKNKLGKTVKGPNYQPPNLKPILFTERDRG